MGLAAHLQGQSRVGHVVPGAEHQGRNAVERGNLFDVPNPLDALDLGDDADVAVRRPHVERVVLIQGGVGDARRERPGTERAGADGSFPKSVGGVSLIIFPHQVFGWGLLTIVYLF